MSVVGVVGLGTMGSEIAARLLDTGHDVVATNRTPAKAQGLIDRGLRWRDTPRAVAQQSDVVISMVTDDHALGAVTAGPDGVIAGLSPEQVYIDMSSVSPRASVEIAGHVRSVGARMLDAPVSGSVPQVQTGTLSIMVGGDPAAFERVRTLLGRLGSSVTRVGDNGAGVLLKLAINISLASQTLAFSEGLLLAQRGGIDPQVAADAMTSSPIGSPMLKARAPMMLDLPEASWFTIRLMSKDIRLAIDEAARRSLALPTASAAEEMLDAAAEHGYADRDIAALYAALGRVGEGRP